MQCLGRYTAERKNIPQEKFANKPKFGFFLPARCKALTANRVCDSCLARIERIPSLLEKWKGSMQNQSEQIHGLVGEPIPEWSRIYKGPYYLAKIEAGWSISPESERIAEEAYTAVEIVTVEMPRKKPVAVAEVKAVPAEVPVPEPPKPFRKAPTKKKTEPIAVIDTLSPPDILRIKVKVTEIDGRTVYLSNVKDKVYDMKYNYLGRYNRKADKIDTAYADSDSGC